MDLRTWDFELDGSVKLSGQWAFFWKELFRPDQTSDPDTDIEEPWYLYPALIQSPDYRQEAERVYLDVPKSWDDLVIHGEELKGKGYGTYYLKVQLDNPPKLLGLRIPEMGNAYRLFINGTEVARNGVVSGKKDEMTPQWLPITTVIPVLTNTLKFVLQISSYYHRSGGFWYPIEMGTAQYILQKREKNIALELFVLGILAIMSVYHFGLYILRPHDKSPLLFSFLTAVIGIRIFITGEKYLIHLFPYLGWTLSLKLEYLSFYASVPLFLLFIRSLFPEDCRPMPIRINNSISGIYCLIVLLLPSDLYTYSLSTYQWFAVAVGFYGTFVIVQAARREREGARLFLFGWILFFISVINEILYYARIIDTVPVLPLGLFVFIFILALLLSMRFSRALTTTEILTGELEREVRKRIEELNKVREDMHKAKDQPRSPEERELDSLLSFIDGLQRAAGVEKVLDQIMLFSHRKYKIEGAMLWLLDSGRREFYTYKYSLEPSFSPATRRMIGNLRVPLRENQGLVWHIYSRKKAVYLRKFREPLRNIERIIVDNLSIKSIFQIPIIVDNEVIGILTFTSHTMPMRLKPQDIKDLKIIAEHFSRMFAKILPSAMES